MPINITVTKRAVKNKTGIDMSVTGHTAAPSARQVKDYHVVIITRLPHFKRAEHSEDDVVQFMVPRDYAAFEKLQKDVLEAYPNLQLPGLPRKFHVFFDDSDVEERQVAFDCLVKVIAKHKEMCCSSALLNFLGFSLLADREYYKARREYLQKMEEGEAKAKKTEASMFSGREEVIDRGLFGEGVDTATGPEDTITKVAKTKAYTGESIFDEGKVGRKSAKVTLLDEENSDDLFIPSGVRTGKSTTGDDDLFTTEEDNSDLLNVSESLDDVLHIATDATKKKSAKKVAPASSKSKEISRGLFDVDDTGADGTADDMGTDDIMKYIQQNQAADDDDLELF